jgi:hypothetical protein
MPQQQTRPKSPAPKKSSRKAKYNDEQRRIKAKELDPKDAKYLLKNGRIVSKAKEKSGKRAFENISDWTKAAHKARQDLHISGFCPVGGPTAEGKALLKKAQEHKEKMSGKKSSRKKKA